MKKKKNCPFTNRCIINIFCFKTLTYVQKLKTKFSIYSIKYYALLLVFFNKNLMVYSLAYLNAYKSF